MPQIWLSYEELAEYLGCGGPQAANLAASAHWPRRRCSDGLMRTKLPPEEAAVFMREYAARIHPGAQTGLLISTLQSILRAAQRPESIYEAAPPDCKPTARR